MDLVEAHRRPGPRHPWETARLRFFERILIGLDAEQGAPLLDIGAGDAWLSQELARRHPGRWKLSCVDPNYTEEFLSEAGSPDVRLARCLPSQVDHAGAMLLDVLEPVEDDEGLLREVVARVRRGGWILVSVPAWPRLYSSHDVRLRHLRRYRWRDLRSILFASGLVLGRGGGLFVSLVPVRLGAKLLEERTGEGRQTARGAAEQWDGGPILTAVLHGLLVFDGWLCGWASRLALPVPGLSWWMLCRKP